METVALYTGDLGGPTTFGAPNRRPSDSPRRTLPAGQAAWIYDKFQSKTDNHGHAEDALSIDDMLDAISLC